MNWRSQKYIMEGGERYALLLDDHGMPAFYPTLYITTQIRNSGKAVATEEQSLAGIKILLDCCSENTIDLEQRIRSGKFLSAGELDALRDHCQKKQKHIRAVKVIPMKKGYVPKIPKVKTATTYIYLTRIAAYLKWLSQYLLSEKRFTQDIARKIDAFIGEVLERRPFMLGRNVDDEAYRGISDEQERIPLGKRHFCFHRSSSTS
jgi:hypothetical protein